MRVFILILGLLISTLTQANLRLSIEPQSVKLGETFQLTIMDDANTKIQSVPNLTALQEDFIILGTERSVNYSNINGQISTVSQWIIMMRAKKAGTLTIPSIPVGLQNTQATTILVRGDNNSSAVQESSNIQKDIKLLTEVDNEKPFINQQTLYTVKIFSSRRLLDSHYQPPEVENALMIPLGDSQSYQHEENGKMYMVDELHYALFPQKSGTLTIKPPVFTAVTYDVTPSQISTENKPMQLSIQSIPKAIPASIWLPAKNVLLKEDYENTETTFKQGSTLVRTINVEAIAVPGQLMQALPAFNFEDKNQFSVYPEPGKEKSIIRGNDIVGKVDLKITYLLNKAGKIKIPELQVPWFNTNTGKQEIAVLAARTLDIIATTDNASTKATTSTATSKTAPIIAQAEKSSWPWAIAAVFGLAWIITLGLWLKQKKGWGAGKITYRKRLQNLQEACTKGDAQQTREALLQWAKLHWPEANILNMNDLMFLVQDINLKKQLQSLSQSLYSNEAKKQWSGDALWRVISQLINIKKGQKPAQSTLPPMNKLGN